MFSFGIIGENFEVFENDSFYCKVLGMVGKGAWNTSSEYLGKLFHDERYKPLINNAITSKFRYKLCVWNPI